MAYISECVAYHDIKGDVQLAEDGILYLHLQLNREVDFEVTLNPMQAYLLGKQRFEAANSVTIDQMENKSIYGGADIMLETDAAKDAKVAEPEAIPLAEKIA